MAPQGVKQAAPQLLARRPLPPIGPNPAQAIHIRFARALISILRCSYFIGANKTDS